MQSKAKNCFCQLPLPLARLCLAKGILGDIRMTYILIHHTGCGSSKKGLALLQENGIEPEVRKYMKAGARLSIDELKDIAEKMGGVSPREFLRDKDAVKFELPETASDEEVFSAMVENPRLIQRPIGINGDKAVLGRPNDKLLEI
ncbi:MAG: ArsC/Spx/MgsR family protein, partial [Pseudomonadota bacterium]|nr:ArsC/Spx/MgsR family protein [Pseudomonadota bacterium]